MSSLQNNLIIEDIIESVEEKYPDLSSVKKYKKAQEKWNEIQSIAVDYE